MRNDREALYRGMGRPLAEGLRLEYELGMRTLESGETLSGADRFARGEGRRGVF